MKVRKKKIVLVSVVTILILLVVWIAWSNKALMVNEITISSDRIPESFSGFRIVQISDLHNAEFGKNNEKLLELIAETKPDIIVLTGDLVDSKNTNIEGGILFAEQVVQIAPTYYVTGNHEARISEYHMLKSGLETAGVELLTNKSVLLENSGEHITLLGINDPSFTMDYQLYDSATTTIHMQQSLLNVDDTYKVLLAHRPEFFDLYVQSGVDLVFSGHAHGGQFRLPMIGGLVAPGQGWFPEYDAGVYYEGNTTMIVSRGIGNSIIPIRINNRPEIVVVELLRE